MGGGEVDLPAILRGLQTPPPLPCPRDVLLYILSFFLAFLLSCLLSFLLPLFEDCSLSCSCFVSLFKSISGGTFSFFLSFIFLTTVASSSRQSMKPDLARGFKARFNAIKSKTRLFFCHSTSNPSFSFLFSLLLLFRP